MASQDSSFSATGQTVVAFETIGTGPRAFGVGVNGNRCGVHGEGMARPLGPRVVSVSGVGVHGRGDDYGVYGIAGTIKSDDAPELGSFPPHPIGVIGVSDPVSTAPAVLGINGVLKGAMTANPTLHTDITNTIASASVGVVGVSAAGGGVVGVAGLTRASGHEALNHASSNLSSNGLNGFNSGVTGVGVGPGAGLYAVASGGRGGIFQSLPSPALRGQFAAQVQLVPLHVPVSAEKATTPVKTPLPSLPTLGQLGDLISVVTTAPGTASVPSLWFCVQSGKGPADPAHWAEILFGRAIIGSA
jgi:hypothetical protein